MLQKNPVFKKLAALTLSASVCTTMVRAGNETQRYSTEDIFKYVGCILGAVFTASTVTSLGWKKLFVNTVLSTAESLVKELNKKAPNVEKVKQLSMTFAKLLHEATAPPQDAYNPKGDTFGCDSYKFYGNPQKCKLQAHALVNNKLSSTSSDKSAPGNDKIKVNRLRHVDRKKLRKALQDLFYSISTDQVERQDVESPPINVTPTSPAGPMHMKPSPNESPLMSPPKQGHSPSSIPMGSPVQIAPADQMPKPKIQTQSETIPTVITNPMPMPQNPPGPQPMQPNLSEAPLKNTPMQQNSNGPTQLPPPVLMNPGNPMTRPMQQTQAPTTPTVMPVQMSMPQIPPGPQQLPPTLSEAPLKNTPMQQNSNGPTQLPPPVLMNPGNPMTRPMQQTPTGNIPTDLGMNPPVNQSPAVSESEQTVQTLAATVTPATTITTTSSSDSEKTSK